jgi:hypothetical protein
MSLPNQLTHVTPLSAPAVPTTPETYASTRAETNVFAHPRTAGGFYSRVNLLNVKAFATERA